MATNTTNYNLVKPAYADTADIADINGNMDIIDGQMKTNADGVSANATSLAKSQGGLAYIVGNTNTTGSVLAAGTYVYVKGHSSITEGLRKVTASISNNGNITTSNTSAVSDGGLNSLNSNLAESETSDVSIATGVTKVLFNAKKQLNIVCVKGTMQKTLVLNTWNLLCTLPAGYRPSGLVEYAFVNGTLDNPLRGKIDSNGELAVYPNSNNSSASVANILFCATFFI